MAKSHHVIERMVRRKFNRFFRVDAEKKRLPVSVNGKTHEFDLFAPRRVIGGISTSPWRNRGGKRTDNTGGQDRAASELLLLSLWRGKERRFYITTNAEMATKLVARFSGCPFRKAIEIWHFCRYRRVFRKHGEL